LDDLEALLLLFLHARAIIAPMLVMAPLIWVWFLVIS